MLLEIAENGNYIVCIVPRNIIKLKINQIAQFPTKELQFEISRGSLLSHFRPGEIKLEVVRQKIIQESLSVFTCFYSCVAMFPSK